MCRGVCRDAEGRSVAAVMMSVQPEESRAE
jgi:hypothetical protein